MVLRSVEQVLMFSGGVYISGTEHKNEVEILYAYLSDTYKHYIEILPCLSDHRSKCRCLVFRRRECI